MQDIVSAFQALNIDTKHFASGKHYVQCPSDDCQNRKKKNQKTLLLDFSNGHYECFHCHWKGFALKGESSAPPIMEPPPKIIQRFLPEPAFNWIFPDTIIDPVPEKLSSPEGKFNITFYMRNDKGLITSAKRMMYNFSDGEMRRDKENLPLFTTSRDEGYYPCIFYEHFLTKYPKATVLLVESEKTACLLTYKFKDYLHEYVYLAVGGSNGLTDEKLHPLRGRTIWVVYDCDNGEIQPDGSVKKPKGREGAESAHLKLEKIANSRIIDLDPKKTDGTDLADLYHDINIDFIRNLANKIPQKIQELWDEVMLTEEPPPDIPIITRHGITLASLSNHSLVTGFKKSRKTLFLVQLITWFLENNSEDELLLFDTEQGKSHVWKVRKKVFQMTGKWVPVFFLRGKTLKERKLIIKQTVQYWPKTLKWIIIDGVRDLVANINDPEAATDIIIWLEKMIVRYGPHITNVLHLNKGDGTARGHLGTELANKAEMTYKLVKDPKTGITTVECESSREKEFESFGLIHDARDLPEIVGTPVKGEVISNDDRKSRLKFVFENGLLSPPELMENIRNHFAVGKTKAYQLKAEFERNGWIIRSGDTKSKDCKYKLLVGENGQEMKPVPKPVNPDLFTESQKHEELEIDDLIQPTDDNDLPF